MRVQILCVRDRLGESAKKRCETENQLTLGRLSLFSVLCQQNSANRMFENEKWKTRQKMMISQFFGVFKGERFVRQHENRSGHCFKIQL